MVQSHPCKGDLIKRPYIMYGDSGVPLPIDALPDTQFPFMGTELLIVWQAGQATQMPFVLLGSLITAPVTLATTLSGTLALTQLGGYFRVNNNSGGPLIITPHADPQEGARFDIIDWGRNASEFPWTFNGTLNGNQVNPVVNQFAGGLVTLIYSAQGGWGTSP